MDESAAVVSLRAGWIGVVDGTNATHLALDAVTAMLARYLADDTLAGVFSERATVWSCLFSLWRQIGNSGNSLGDESPWYGLVDQELADTLAALALDDTYTADTEFLVDNAQPVEYNQPLLKIRPS